MFPCRLPSLFDKTNNPWWRQRRTVRPVTRRRMSVRLILESLEERLTPSGGNPTVTQTAGGYTALTQAIAADTAANTNYVIQITGSFQFNSGGQVTISKLGAGSTLTLQGQNGSNFTLTGNGNRLFDVASGQTVTFKDLTLTGGTVTNGPAQGGAILDAGGNVTLSSVVVQGNTATSNAGAKGGGVFCSGDGSLAIQGGSTIKSNRAIGMISSSASGGGVFASGGGSVKITDSTLSNNSVQVNPGGKGGIHSGGSSGSGFARPAASYFGGKAEGGGLYVNISAVQITGSTVTKNDAKGVMVIGGGVFDSGSGYVKIADSILSNNSLQATSGGNNYVTFARGAGLYVTAGGQTVTLTGDTLSGNTVAGIYEASGGGAAFESSFKGGGNLTANILNTTFYGNKLLADSAEGGGAEFYVLSGTASISMLNSTVANNTVAGTKYSAAGGGIDFETGATSATLYNDTITQNTITGVSSGSLYEPNGGAGIYAGYYESAEGILTPGHYTLTNNLIQGNQSIGTFTPDLLVATDNAGDRLANVTNNFIGTVNGAGIDTSAAARNIVNDNTPQLGSVVGVDAKGNLTGGPIYYPLLPGAASIGAGNTGVLNTIAFAEDTTAADATDETGNPRSIDGSIDLGAIESQNPSRSSAPAVIGIPSSQTVAAGGNVSFSCTAIGNPTPTVQWQVSSDGGKSFSNISGATSAVLTLTGVTASMNGNEYQAVFTNSTGSATSSVVTLTVTPNTTESPPVITGNPSSQTVIDGNSATFTASAIGDPMPSVYWEVSSDGGRTFNYISFATSTSLTIPKVSPAMNGNVYRAVFSNSGGSVISQYATLTVQTGSPSPPPSATTGLQIPPLLAFLNSLFGGGTEAINANGAETITDSFLGIPLIVSTFDSSGKLVDVTLFGIDITFLILSL